MIRNRTRKSPGSLLGKVVAALLFAVAPASAQQAPSNAPQQTSTSQQQPAAARQQGAAATPSKDQAKPGDQNKTADKTGGTTQSGTSNDRLFYALPNFLTVQNAEELPPLTPGQKFKVVARGSFDYVEFPWYGILAGISQAQNSEPGYGQGASGYGKRYGAAFADGTIETFMTQAVLPSVLHQDPRFYQLGQGTFLHRSGYAVSRIFLTRSDSGHTQFNFSEIFGSAISAGISTYSYHPHAERTLSNTASVWGSQIGYDVITIVVKEFWPDIRRKLSHKSQQDQSTP